ncbi:MAG: peptidoglycan-binding domain-containing protein, partial [Brasilonema sp.]
MERIGYLQLATANEASTTNEQTPSVQFDFNLFAELKWRKLSSHAITYFLLVALTLVVSSIAERALANQQVGSTGAQVSSIQRCLSKLGYYNGPVTGKFASLTRDAVIRFQRANGLPTVGSVGPRTQQLLQSQCQARRPGASVSSGLQTGSKGQAVTRLQQDLQRLDYFNGPITGYFGPETQRAVIKFQQSRGITPDGVVGARTKEAIRIVLSRNNSSVGFGGDRLPNALNLGDSGTQVRELQQDLQQLGYFRLNPTGYFGPTTQEAIARFQQDYGIVPNGVGDSQTLGAITTVLERQSYEQNSGQSYEQNSGQSYEQNSGQSYEQNSGQSYGCSTATGDICQGERSQRVTVVQQRLQNLGFFRGDATGYYGPATRDAIVQFQQYNRLETT